MSLVGQDWCDRCCEEPVPTLDDVPQWLRPLAGILDYLCLPCLQKFAEEWAASYVSPPTST